MTEKEESASVCCDYWGRCPCPKRWPKCLASICAFVFCMCVVSFSDAFFVGSISSSITTLETRYSLSLSKIALIGTVYNIGALTVQLFVVYFGGKRSRNRPQWIGVGLMFISIGTIIIFLPQFIYGEYDFYALQTESRCSLNKTDYEGCSADEQSQNDDNSKAFIFLAVGAAIAGAAWTPVKPLGFSYIDDNTNTGNSAFYIGIVNSMYGVGSIISFVASSFFIKLWVDFYRVNTDDIQLTSDDDDWAGAWWLGIMVTGFIILISALPFFCFPKQLLARPPKEVVKSEEETNRNCGLPRSTWRLLRNLPFMTANLGFVTTVAIVFGITGFIPKYLETQFGLSTSTANLLTGLVPVPAFGLGQLVGGFLIKKIRAGITESAKVLFVTSLITLTGLLIMLGLGCSSRPIAGISTTYDENSESLTLNSECNVECGCPEIYDPVCGDDGVTYFSPCHAGCIDEVGQPLETCSCVGSGVVDSSPCSLTCNTLAPFVVLLFVIACTNSMEEVPQTMVTLRSVDKDDKAMAIGMREIFMRLFGMIPAPLLFGAAIDSSCIFWEETCGDKGSCLIYNLDDFRFAFFGVVVALKVFSVLCNLICWRTLAARDSQREDEKRLEIKSESVHKKRVTFDRNSLALINYGFDDTSSANGDVVKLTSKVINDINGVPNGIQHKEEPKPVTPIWIDNVHVVTSVPRPDDVTVISEFKPPVKEPDPEDKVDVVEVVSTNSSPTKLKWLMPIQGSMTSLNTTDDQETHEEPPSTSIDAQNNQKIPSKLKWTIPKETNKSIPTISRSVSDPALGDSDKVERASDMYHVSASRLASRPTSTNTISAVPGKQSDDRRHNSMGALYDIMEQEDGTESRELTMMPNGWGPMSNGQSPMPNGRGPIPNGWGPHIPNGVIKPVQKSNPTYATVKKIKPNNSTINHESQTHPDPSITERNSYGLESHNEPMYSAIDDMRPRQIDNQRPSQITRPYTSEPGLLPDQGYIIHGNGRGVRPLGKRKPMDFTELPRSAAKRFSLPGNTLSPNGISLHLSKQANGLLKQNGIVNKKRSMSVPSDECPASIYI